MSIVTPYEFGINPLPPIRIVPPEALLSEQERSMYKAEIKKLKKELKRVKRLLPTESEER